MWKNKFSQNIFVNLKRLVKLPLQLYKKQPKTLAVLLLAVVLAGSIIGAGIVKRGQASIDRPTLDVVKQLPFKPVLPENKTVEWRKISPPGSEPVYAYNDTLAETDIIVSQQELPRKLREPDNLKNLAEQFNATNTLNVSGTTTYIGRSAKGPQSVIFAKNDVLVLIKSKDTIKDSAWIGYVASFK